MIDPRPISDRRPLSYGVVLAIAIYAVLYRFVPYDLQAFLLWPFGALALYSGARLRAGQALAVVFAVQAGSDVIFYFTNHWGISKTTYLSFGLFVILGVMVRPLLRRHWLDAAAGVGAASIVGYALFFLITNTAAWLGNAEEVYRPHTLGTLLIAYREGLEFIRYQPGQVFGNPLCVGLVFGAHALLARAYFPAERFGPEAAR